MLCDDLIAEGAPGSGCDISRMYSRIAKAQKFTLGPDFAAVADALSSDYTGLVRAFPFCRLPYPSMWIEVAQQDRPQFAKAGIHVPVFQIQPKRIGFLLEATRSDLSAWKAHLFWSLVKGGCCCPSLAMRFDMTHDITGAKKLPTREEEIKAARESILLRDEPLGSHPGWMGAADTIKLAMLQHCDPIIPDYGVPDVPYEIILENKVDEFSKMIAELSRADWAGEPGFVLAVIGLLNARNATEAEPVYLAKLNKARTKRGKKPLFEHKVLRIAHRQIKRVYPDGQHRGDYTPMRGHFVRGHWKVRKTGIYFWHPHARGGFKRGTIFKTYEVT